MNNLNYFQIHGNVSQALHILTVYKNYRYEFIFNNLNTKCTRHYTSVIGVYRYVYFLFTYFSHTNNLIIPLQIAERMYLRKFIEK